MARAVLFAVGMRFAKACFPTTVTSWKVGSETKLCAVYADVIASQPRDKASSCGTQFTAESAVSQYSGIANVVFFKLRKRRH
jgi:hypothetical protein